MSGGEDEEMMTEQQSAQHTAEANDTLAPSQATPDQPARSKTTSILIVLIAVASVAIVALALALTRPFAKSGKSKSTDPEIVITEAPSSFPSFSPSARPTTAIPNWDLNYLGVATDLGDDSTNDITFMYEIGMGRTYQFDLFATGCRDDIIGLNYTTTTVTNAASAVTDNLEIQLDVESMKSIRDSNIWNDSTSAIELCITVELVSPSMVVKRDTRNIAINIVMMGVFR